jgi:hypothetical protein
VAFLRPAAPFLVAVPHERTAPGAVTLTRPTTRNTAEAAQLLRLPPAQDRHSSLLEHRQPLEEESSHRGRCFPGSRVETLPIHVADTLDTVSCPSNGLHAP